MPLTILVVDDESAIRLSVSDYLEMSGYSVIAAENGERALEMLERYHPHLIVTDVTMPQIDGYELVRKIRQRPEFRLLPVIFLTARTDTHERIRGYQLGGDLYLPKPFDLDELGAVIRNLLDRSQMVQSEWRLRTQAQGPEETRVQVELTSPLLLTQREKDVLKFLAGGLSNSQIGDHLHLSPRTIEKHVSSLLRKTETSNRAELVRFAIEHHLVD
jgi:DNA-binding NarL/FixJ family response regulator